MNKIDLTTPGQKGFALVLLIIAIWIIKWLLPPTIFFLENLLYAGFLGIVVILAIWNYPTIWAFFKVMSWNLTKFLISKDKLGHLYRYYDYILDKNDKIYDNLKNVSASKVSLERKISNLQKNILNNSNMAVEAEKQNNKIAYSSFSNKVNIDNKQLLVLKPRLEMILNQESGLRDMYEMTGLQADQLKYSIDAKAEEYKLLKEVDAATNSASSLIENNSTEYKIYQESLKQLEEEATSFISNIENFEIKIKPILANMETEKAVNAEEGHKLVQEFKTQTQNLFKNGNK